MNFLNNKAVLGLAAMLSIVTMSTSHAYEVSSSVSVASSYLFRGVDLSTSSAAVSGDVTVSEGPGYASVWVSSGDDSEKEGKLTGGTEYDLIAGVGGDVQDVSWDLNVTNYNYPKSDDAEFGAISDVTLSVDTGLVSASVVKNIAGSAMDYYSVGASLGDLSVLVGKADQDEAYTHVDLSIALSEELSLTASKVVDQKKDDSVSDALNVVISYTHQIK
jgi:uncharacterized protein (TIGR02001 family)